MPTQPEHGNRLTSLDIIRGVVMILMAIDHVRVYSGIPAGGPTVGVFFTRWVTHFCAPAFVFFAGTAAFLHGRKLGDTRALARFLVVRGLLLVVLELTVIRFSWTFNVDYSQFVLAGVIWMIGWCMVLLAAFVWLSPRTLGLAGVLIILLQQVFAQPARVLPDGVAPTLGIHLPGGVGRVARDDRALHDRPVDRRDGCGIRVRDDPPAGSCRSPPVVSEDRPHRDGALRCLDGAHRVAVTLWRRQAAPGPAPLERVEVSGESVVPLDDARTRYRAASGGGARARLARRRRRHIRASADVLLPAAHSADSRQRAVGQSDSERAARMPPRTRRRPTSTCRRRIAGVSGCSTSCSSSTWRCCTGRAAGSRA